MLAAPATFGLLVERFLAMHKINVRPGTLKGYRVRLERWQKYIPSSTPLLELTSDMIRGGMVRMSETMKPLSVNSFFRPLKVCLNYAVDSGFLRDRPYRGIKPLKGVQAEPKWWTPAEISKMLAAAEVDPVAPRDAHLIVALALYLGMRRGEIDRMKWTDLALNDDKPVACIRSVPTAKTKSGKTRYIPICIELKVILLRYRPAEVAPDEYVVRPIRPTGGVWIYRYDFTKLFNRVMKAAAVPTIRFHDTRHSWASFMAVSGIPVFKFSRWLGHAETKTTEQVYAVNGGPISGH